MRALGGMHTFFSEPYINVICPSVRLMSVFVVEQLDPVLSIGAF